MKKDIYDKSIKTGELQLVGIWANLTHYGIVGFVLIVPTMLLCFHLIDYLQHKPSFYQKDELRYIVIPPILAGILYLIQKARLKFSIVKTSLNHTQLKQILIELAETCKWVFISNTPDSSIAITNPGFFSGSWGEQITILFYQDTVYVNSICDPNKHSSLVSWGRNRKNEQTFINKIKEADGKLTLTPK